MGQDLPDQACIGLRFVHGDLTIIESTDQEVSEGIQDKGRRLEPVFIDRFLEQGVDLLIRGIVPEGIIQVKCQQTLQEVILGIAADGCIIEFPDLGDIPHSFQGVSGLLEKVFVEFGAVCILNGPFAIRSRRQFEGAFPVRECDFQIIFPEEATVDHVFIQGVLGIGRGGKGRASFGELFRILGDIFVGHSGVNSLFNGFRCTTADHENDQERKKQWNFHADELADTKVMSLH